MQIWIQPKSLISRADWSDKSEWYCLSVHCFQNIWFNKKNAPNEHWNGHQLLTKWALGSDQSSVRSWPCAASKEVATGRCAGRGCALIRQLASGYACDKCNVDIDSLRTPLTGFAVLCGTTAVSAVMANLHSKRAPQRVKRKMKSLIVVLRRPLICRPSSGRYRSSSNISRFHFISVMLRHHLVRIVGDHTIVTFDCYSAGARFSKNLRKILSLA